MLSSQGLKKFCEFLVDESTPNSLWLYSDGNTGKTTLIKALKAAVGDQLMYLPFGKDLYRRKSFDTCTNLDWFVRENPGVKYFVFHETEFDDFDQDMYIKFKNYKCKFIFVSNSKIPEMLVGVAVKLEQYFDTPLPNPPIEEMGKELGTFLELLRQQDQYADYTTKLQHYTQLLEKLEARLNQSKK